MINDVSEYIQHVLGATGESDGGDEPADAHAHHSVYYAELPPIQCETCVRLHSQLLCCGWIDFHTDSLSRALSLLNGAQLLGTSAAAVAHAVSACTRTK